MDFGICQEVDGIFIFQFIEVQGFFFFYFFQDLVACGYWEIYDILEGYFYFFGGLIFEMYFEKLWQVIIGDYDLEEVILLEVELDK